MIQAGRKGSCKRKTKETDIALELNIDGRGRAEISTGIGFFDHMLTALAVHGSLDIALKAKGDLETDGHHTVEDCGIALGLALKEALGDKAGICRFGNMLLPMDDALAMAAVDISGRPYLVFKAAFQNERIGDYETCLTREFFQGLTSAAGITLHIRLLEGENDHHACEAIFKAFAHSLKQAAAKRGEGEVLSSKGVLA